MGWNSLAICAFEARPGWVGRCPGTPPPARPVWVQPEGEKGTADKCRIEVDRQNDPEDQNTDVVTTNADSACEGRRTRDVRRTRPLSTSCFRFVFGRGRRRKGLRVRCPGRTGLATGVGPTGFQSFIPPRFCRAPPPDPDAPGCILGDPPDSGITGRLSGPDPVPTAGSLHRRVLRLVEGPALGARPSGRRAEDPHLGDPSGGPAGQWPSSDPRGADRTGRACGSEAGRPADAGARAPGRQPAAAKARHDPSGSGRPARAGSGGAGFRRRRPGPALGGRDHPPPRLGGLPLPGGCPCRLESAGGGLGEGHPP